MMAASQLFCRIKMIGLRLDCTFESEFVICDYINMIAVLAIERLSNHSCLLKGETDDYYWN